MTADGNYVQRVIRDLSERLPDCDMDLVDLYALLALARGRATTLEDVHDAWAIWRNTSNPEHRSLIPFADLSPEVREMDRKYMKAIHEVAGLRLLWMLRDAGYRKESIDQLRAEGHAIPDGTACCICWGADLQSGGEI